MRVTIRSPDAGRRERLIRVLEHEPDVEVVNERADAPDIVLIDADLMQGNGRPLQSLRTSAITIVVFAPGDPDQLARFLAAGARGYHCLGEPWQQLTDLLRQTLDGDVRSDPVVMNRLLHLYRYVRREFISRRLHEAC